MSTNESMKDRIKLFCDHPFFTERPSLIVALLSVEMQTGIKLPNTFEISITSEFSMYDIRVVLGKANDYYFFGMGPEDGYIQYQAFESKKQLFLYFRSMDNIDREDRAYLLNQVENMPN